VLFLVHRFLSPWWRRRQVPPKRRFLQEPHGVTTQKSPFFLNLLTLWPLVRERTIPTERPPLVDEISCLHELYRNENIRCSCHVSILQRKVPFCQSKKFCDSGVNERFVVDILKSSPRCYPSIADGRQIQCTMYQDQRRQRSWPVGARNIRTEVCNGVREQGMVRF
jgi:hypothetical protein